LEKHLIWSRLYKGDDNIENISGLMTPSEIHDLKEEKMMKICDFNKKIFSHGEEVKIFIEMKNI